MSQTNYSQQRTLEAPTERVYKTASLRDGKSFYRCVDEFICTLQTVQFMLQVLSFQQIFDQRHNQHIFHQRHNNINMTLNSVFSQPQHTSIADHPRNTTFGVYIVQVTNLLSTSSDDRSMRLRSCPGQANETPNRAWDQYALLWTIILYIIRALR